MMLSGNIAQMTDLIQTNFYHKMTSYQSLVLTRISPQMLMVDQGKKAGIIDDRSLAIQHELPVPEGSALRSTALVGGDLFVGYANGIL